MYLHHTCTIPAPCIQHTYTCLHHTPRCSCRLLRISVPDHAIVALSVLRLVHDPVLVDAALCQRDQVLERALDLGGGEVAAHERPHSRRHCSHFFTQALQVRLHLPRDGGLGVRG
jgi:hypothetical protein